MSLALASKAATHTVFPTPHVFVVTSGTSGKTYTVTPFDGGRVICSCEWGRSRSGDCSHVVAVRNFAARVLAKGK